MATFQTRDLMGSANRVLADRDHDMQVYQQRVATLNQQREQQRQLELQAQQRGMQQRAVDELQRTAPRMGSSVFIPHKRPDNSSQIQQLLASLNTQSTAANTEGKARYEQLLKLYGDLQNRVIGAGGMFEGLSQAIDQSATTTRDRIAGNRQKAEAQSEQDLISRGLGNTTIRASAKRGIASDAERAQQEADAQTALLKGQTNIQKAAMDVDLSRLYGDAILSRQDIGPSTDQYLNLIMALSNR